MVAPIRCKAAFDMKGYGWTEEYIYAPAADELRTFAEAQKAFQVLMTRRAEMFPNQVVYGVHYDHPYFSYHRDDATGESWTDWTPTLSLQDSTTKVATTTDIEPPFVGYMIRAHAGPQYSRTMLFRPLPNTSYLDPAGKKVAQDTIREKVSNFFVMMEAMKCWAMKALNKSLSDKQIVTVQTTGLPAGEAYLYVPEFSAGKGQEVAISGGDKHWKPLRGRHIVYSTQEGNIIHIKTEKAIPFGPCNARIRPVAYHYPMLQTYFDLRLSKRDTGAPTALGRGRR